MLVELSCYPTKDTKQPRVHDDGLLMDTVPRIGEKIEILENGVSELYTVTSITYSKELNPQSATLDRWVVHVDACRD